jgi:hypothetical protein
MKPFRLSRRACLRGAGVALSLPLLEAMELPKAQAAGANPVRFLCVYSPNGFLMDKFTPAGNATGPLGTLSPLLTPLEPFKADMNVITGLGNYTASLYNAFGGSHTRSCGSLLTQCPIMAPESGSIGNGVSLDQVLAEKLKDLTRYASIEVGGRANNATGNCEDQFSCAYNNNISWKNPTTPQVKQVNPRDVFNRFFKDLPTTQPTMPTENKDALYQKSILDVVLTHSEGLRGKLGKSDLAKLDQYLTSLRDVEMRIAHLVDGMVTGRACTVPAPPTDINMDQVPFDQHLDLLSDLVVLAFQCDIVRVGTFMFEHSFSDQRNFSFIGISSGHHQLTHEDTASAATDEAKINAFYVDRFKYLLTKMKAATEGDSNVLDNSIVYLTSEFGNAHIHDMRGLPMVVAGKAGGKFKTGQHIVYPLAPGAGTGGDGKGNKDDVQVARLHMSVLTAMDLPQASFGHDDQNQPIATTGLSELMA